MPMDTLCYTVPGHGTWSIRSFYCSRAEVELMILVKPRKRTSGNKVFSSLIKAPQKHCTDLNIKTSTSSKRTTALRQPSGFQLASNVIYSTKKALQNTARKRIQRLFTCNLRVMFVFGSKWRLLIANPLIAGESRPR